MQITVEHAKCRLLGRAETKTQERKVIFGAHTITSQEKSHLERKREPTYTKNWQRTI